MTINQAGQVQVSVSSAQETQIALAVPGVQGPVGPGFPSGGTTNQVLVKSSATNYDAAWSEVTSAMIGDLQIVNADVATSAAIAGTKVSPNFGSQTVTTSGVISSALGAAATPSITFTGDLNTGIYSPGADQVAVATNGTQRLTIDSSGNVISAGDLYANGTNGLVLFNADPAGYNISRSGGNLTFMGGGTISVRAGGTGANNAEIVYSNNPFLAFKTANSERLRITYAGNVGIGTSAPSSALHVKGGSVNPSAIVHLQPDNNTVSNYITFRSATDTTRGYIEYNYASDSLAFATTNGTERARIDSSGRLLAGTSTANTSGAKLQTSDGLTFPATQVASADPNTLDDYEEGVFTPTVIGTTTAGTATYTIQTGRYTKTGNVVTFLIYVNYSGGTGSGELRLSGLPFTVGSGVNTASVAFGLYDQISVAANNILSGYTVSSTSTIGITNLPVGNVGAASNQAYDAAGVLMCAGSYFTT